MDLVRELIAATWGIDDPASAAEIPAPRLRFALAEGPTVEAALDEAVHRVLALVAMLPGRLLVRLVDWDPGGPPPGEGWLGPDDTPTADGTVRRTWVLPVGDRAVLADLVRLALTGDRAWDLWLAAVDRTTWLLRPYDDRGADLVTTAQADLAPFAERYGAWTLPGPPLLRCRLAFVCDVDWRQMQPLPDPTVRLCARCERPVHAVATEPEFLARAAEGHCVAFRPDALAVAGPRQPTSPLHHRAGMLAGVPIRQAAPPPRPWWRRLLG